MVVSNCASRYRDERSIRFTGIGGDKCSTGAGSVISTDGHCSQLEDIQRLQASSAQAPLTRLGSLRQLRRFACLRACDDGSTSQLFASAQCYCQEFQPNVSLESLSSCDSCCLMLHARSRYHFRVMGVAALFTLTILTRPKIHLVLYTTMSAVSARSECVERNCFSRGQIMPERLRKL
jgi:hypothetical protein